MKKRVTAMLLIMLLSVLCLQPEAFASAIKFSGDCGDHLTWTLDSDGLLTISGTGDMTDFESHVLGLQEPWYDEKDRIREIVIEPGVTSIGTDAFEHSHYVEKVTIPNTVTKIGEHAFLMNIALEEVILQEGLVSIGNGAFQYCEKLREFHFPDSVRSIGAYSFCEDPLTEVVIPDGVTAIQWSTFHDCQQLRSVVLPDSVTEIAKTAFSGCTALASVTGGDYVVKMGAAAFSETPWQQAQGDFAVLGSVLASYNGNSKNAVLPTGITQIADGALEGHTELKTVSIPGTVTEIGARAFADCTGLTELKMPDSVTKTGDEAFAGCASLTTLVLSKKLETLGEKAFSGCTALTEIEIPAGLTEAKQAFDGCSALKKIIFQDKMTAIPAGLFQNCTGLSGITFPKSLKTIEEKAFSGCTGLTEILFPETLEKIGREAFCMCSGLERIYIPIRVTSIGSGAFYGAAEDLEVYYAGDEMDFFRLEETTRKAMANGYAPYFNATGFSVPGLDDLDPGGFARSGQKSVRKLTWKEICEKFDLLVNMPETLYQTEASVSSKGYRPGVLTADAVNYYQNAINYFRAVAGVAPVTLTKELNESAAWGSLALAMNKNYLTHFPEQPAGMSDEDYARAYYATSHSNLSYSSPPNPIWAIIGQMDDSDSNNAHDLGHRRWLLTPYITKMGVGLAHNNDALFTSIRVFGEGADKIYANDWDFVSWPASGNNLSETFTPDIIWSVSLNEDKYQSPLYREVSVRIRSLRTGTDWELSADSTQETTGWFNVSNQGYGHMDTIVFQPNTSVAFDGDYVVTVSGLHLLDGSDATIQYIVTFKTYGEAKNADDSDYNPFWDVSSKDYYYEPVKWAVQKGITNGTGETTFSPDQVCSRAQVVTFLWRAMGSPAPKNSSSPFTDVTDTNAWYYKAVLWAAENGITAGMDAHHFAPDQTVTRAQFVTFLWRAAGKASAGSAGSPFADVTDPGSWYYSAVLWAVENGITNGIDAAHFGPDNGCTRGQVVTFLYRHLAEK